MGRAADVLGVALLAAALAGCGYGRIVRQLEAEQKDNADLRSLNDTLTQQLTAARSEGERLQNELVKRPATGRPSPPPPAKVSRSGVNLDAKRAELARALAGSGATVTVRGDGLVIAAPVAFESGKATLTSKGAELLARIGKAITHHCPGYEIGVAGHTDSTAIGAATRARYPTNWHLSGFRALAAMDYLTRHTHISPVRIHFRGYGQYHPIANNTTAEGRARNRRIEIFLDPPG